ncbi:3',5'-nucleoside bisphosphate phosphatase [Gammaproteobacteria bacterium]
MTRYDLHTHSTASDGTLSPTELVRRAQERGIEVLALTDHDCTDGVAEATTEANKLGLILIPGMELSVSWENGQTIHMVGLRIDPATPVLQAGLLRLREVRNWRAEEMGRRLATHGILGAFEGAQALARGPIVSRTHFARFLVAGGHSRDMNGAFDHFLVRGKPGYVAGEWATLNEGIDWIQAAGGQAVLAHPLRYPLSSTRLRQLLGQFRDCGGVGLEVISGRHPNDIQVLAQYARTFGLAASVGSDFHHPDSPYTDLGRLADLPPNVQPLWLNW